MPAMTKTAIIIFLFLTSLGCIAQTLKPVPTPIAKEDFLKIKSLNEVLNLPPSYEFISCEFVLTTKADVYPGTIKGPEGLPNFLNFISLARAGDILTLQAIVKKGERQLKLEAKQFILK